MVCHVMAIGLVDMNGNNIAEVRSTVNEQKVVEKVQGFT